MRVTEVLGFFLLLKDLKLLDQLEIFYKLLIFQRFERDVAIRTHHLLGGRVLNFIYTFFTEGVTALQGPRQFFFCIIAFQTYFAFYHILDKLSIR